MIKYPWIQTSKASKYVRQKVSWIDHTKTKIIQKNKSSLIGITYQINNPNKFKINKSKNVNVTISFWKKLLLM